jgi:DNA-binding transcriptional LysR family regulator
MDAVLDWAELELVLRLCEARSFNGAAAHLRVDATTISRRLSRLERKIQTKAFDRIDGLLIATPQLENTLPSLHAMQEAAVLAKATLQQSKATLSGLVRISSVGFIFSQWLAPALQKFQAAHPDVVLEFVAEDRSVSFERRETDLAVRLGRPTSGIARIKRIDTITFRLYISAQHHHSGIDKETLQVVRYDATLDHLPEMQLLEVLCPNAAIALRSSRLDILMTAAFSLGAIIALPEHIGEKDARFVRLTNAHKTAEREVFLMMHPDRIETASVRAVADWINDCFQTQ